MTTGKVLMLYMTMPDMMRAGHRQQCDSLECDDDGIFGDVNYDTGLEHIMLLVSKKSYDIIQDADCFLDKGMLLENIYVDIDLNHLKKGDEIQIGETLFEVTGPCEAYGYLYKFAPEVPDVIQGNRGIFVTPVEHGVISIGDEVELVKY